jgi:cell division protein FtsQ
MARKNVSTTPHEEFDFPAVEPVRADMDDARMLDLKVEEESPFLRAQKRVSVRRGPLPRKAADRLKLGLIVLFLLGLAGTLTALAYNYGAHSWRFTINSGDDIQVSGTQNVTRSQIMEVMGADIGRNAFFVPLADQKKKLEEIPWVESATVMRFWPNRLRVDLRERTPEAFVRIGSRIALIDSNGVVMDLPSAGKKKFSFPVIVGFESAEPLSKRAASMKIYESLMDALNSGGANYGRNLSEVDLSEPDDVKVGVANSTGVVVIHLGSRNFLERYKIYVAHALEWQQQYDRLQTVDLRFDGQIVVNPDLHVTRQQPLSGAALRAAVAAGAAPTALTAVETHSSAVKPTANIKAGTSEHAPATATAKKPHRSRARHNVKRAAPKNAAKDDSSIED